MITKNDIIEESYRLGFGDVGITTAEPFTTHLDYLSMHHEDYDWTTKNGLDLAGGTDPKTVLASAKSIIVLLEIYFREAFPKVLEAHFGRCYLDDDRITKDNLALRIKSFRNYLRDNGIESKVPANLPHRVAAARAGLGTFGKNFLLYSRRKILQGSWIIPITVVIDRAFAPDEPTMKLNCPEWCRNSCIAACPTKALRGNAAIDPKRCVSYLTYFGETITPKELREPMGLYIYGCDHCQNVCPRNRPWLSQELAPNRRAAAKINDFEITSLLHMDKAFFKNRIWPHMFYMSPDYLWKWKMNAARVMGNTLDDHYVGDLMRAYNENNDERIRGMIAWSLGRIGGKQAKNALESFFKSSDGIIREEIAAALELL